MENVASSVRITADAAGLLATLAARMGEPKAQVIERALKDLEERLFWQETREAFERIAADSDASATAATEWEKWDRGTARDFESEQW